VNDVAAELPAWDTTGDGRVAFRDGHLLFTDLEGSTRLWEELPEAMLDALARDDEILRCAVDAHDGVVVSGMGDGI
jgi:class 3 adenylate cyclase